MADTFFVGQTGDPLQVAAVSLTNPIFILFMAFANMFGMGGSATASIAMGEKNEKRMKNDISIYHICIFDHRNIFCSDLIIRSKANTTDFLELINRHMILHMDIYFIFLMEHHCHLVRSSKFLL